MQDHQTRSSSWDEDFPDDERLTDEMAAGNKPSEGEANAGVEEGEKPIASSQTENGETAPKEDRGEPALVEDKSGDVKLASDVASGANTAQTPQKSNSLVAEKMAESMQTDSKNETTTKKADDDSQGDRKNLFKMWSHKSIKGLDSSSTHSQSTSGRPARGVPQKSRSLQTAPKTEEAATGATPPKPGSLDVVNGLEAHLGEELQQLLKDITRCGEKGKPHVKFGELFDDAEVEQYYEALVGTLKNAKKRGLISFEGQMLLKGPSDNVVVSIVKP